MLGEVAFQESISMMCTFGGAIASTRLVPGLELRDISLALRPQRHPHNEKWCLSFHISSVKETERQLTSMAVRHRHSCRYLSSDYWARHYLWIQEESKLWSDRIDMMEFDWLLIDSRTDLSQYSLIGRRKQPLSVLYANILAPLRITIWIWYCYYVVLQLSLIFVNPFYVIFN